MYGYGHSMYLRRFFGGGGGGIDPDAQAFIIAAGINKPIQEAAINDLVIGLKDDGLWNKMKAIYPFVGGTATAHKFNLKDPRDLDAAFRLVFFGGWVHDINGSQPNGTNAYADTKLVPSLNFSSSTFVHLSYYSRTNSATPLEFVMGSTNLITGGSMSLIVRRDNNARNFIADISGASFRNASDTNSLNGSGFFVGNQQGPNCKLIRNNLVAVQNSSAYTGIAISNFPMFLSCLNRGGVAGFYTNKQTAFSTIGNGLTDTEASNLYTRVQAFQTALSRQV